MSRPTTVEEPTRPMIIGRVITPAMVGESPRDIWKYWLRKTVAPNIAVPTARLATTDRVMVELRNRCIGMIGSGARSSTSTNSTARTTAPSTIAIVCQDHQAKVSPASETQISSRETEAATRTAPR